MSRASAYGAPPSSRSPGFTLQEGLWFGDFDDESARLKAASSMMAMAGRVLGARPFPEAARKLVQLTQDDSADINQVVRVLEMDPGLSQRVLRLVNSAGYGLRMRCTSLAHAAALLGQSKMRQIATSAALFDQFGKSSGVTKRRQEHAALVASLCRYLAIHLGLPQDDLFTVGLLHDLGQLMMLDDGSPDYVRLVEAHEHEFDSLHQAEREIYGFDHAVLAGQVMASWSIPSPVPEVVALHHQPAQAHSEGLEIAAMVQTLRFADQMAHLLESKRKRLGPKLLSESEAASYLDFSEVQIAAMWRDLEKVHEANRTRRVNIFDVAPRFVNVPPSLAPRDRGLNSRRDAGFPSRRAESLSPSRRERHSERHTEPSVALDDSGTHESGTVRVSDPAPLLSPSAPPTESLPPAPEALQEELWSPKASPSIAALWDASKEMAPLPSAWPAASLAPRSESTAPSAVPSKGESEIQSGGLLDLVPTEAENGERLASQRPSRAASSQPDSAAERPVVLGLERLPGRPVVQVRIEELPTAEEPSSIETRLEKELSGGAPSEFELGETSFFQPAQVRKPAQSETLSDPSPEIFACGVCYAPTFGAVCPVCRSHVCSLHQGTGEWCVACEEEFERYRNERRFPPLLRLFSASLGTIALLSSWYFFDGSTALGVLGMEAVIGLFGFVLVRTFWKVSFKAMRRHEEKEENRRSVEFKLEAKDDRIHPSLPSKAGYDAGSDEPSDALPERPPLDRPESLEAAPATFDSFAGLDRDRHEAELVASEPLEQNQREESALSGGAEERNATQNQSVSPYARVSVSERPGTWRAPSDLEAPNTFPSLAPEPAGDEVLAKRAVLIAPPSDEESAFELTQTSSFGAALPESPDLRFSSSALPAPLLDEHASRTPTQRYPDRIVPHADVLTSNSPESANLDAPGPDAPRPNDHPEHREAVMLPSSTADREAGSAAELPGNQESAEKDAEAEADEGLVRPDKVLGEHEEEQEEDEEEPEVTWPVEATAPLCSPGSRLVSALPMEPAAEFCTQASTAVLGHSIQSLKKKRSARKDPA